MNAKTHATLTAQPVDEEIGLQHMSSNSHNIATPYSSGGDGTSTDYRSSRATSYESTDQSWEMDVGHDRQGASNYNLSPAMSHPPLPIHQNKPAAREDNAVPPSKSPTTQGRTVPHTNAPPRARKKAASTLVSKVRKNKSAKPGKLGSVTMDTPLSVLTKDSKVPLKNMEKFVHRSTEDRIKEKDKKNGYIVRPMNAFMLYRSAYAERAKGLFDQNNHQIVSKATGMSWKMESREVHDYYKMLSEVERENHQKAWPNYKFSPSKANAAARKRKGGAFSDDDHDGTEHDPTDYDWTPGSNFKVNTIRQPNRRYRPEKAFEGSYPVGPTYPSLPPVEYQYSTARQLPMQIDTLPGMDMSYYTEFSRMYPADQLRDPRSDRVPYAYPGQMLSIPSGFPGANHDELFEMEYIPDPYSHNGFIDPKLEDFGQVHTNGMFTEDGFADYHGEMLHHTQSTVPGQSQQHEPSGSSILEMLSTDPECFQKWIDNENQS